MVYEYNQKPGWIEVICGPMFAGKSEELIRRVKRMQYAHQKFLCFKPEIDKRYSFNEIVSHSQMRISSINVNSSKEILDQVTEPYDAIVIDEVQFLDDGIVDVCTTLANKGCRVIVAGLDSDFKADPFLNMALLMARAEYVTKLTAICAKCGAPATRTQRIVNGIPADYKDPIIIVGASETYEPRCRHCHEVLHNK